MWSRVILHIDMDAFYASVEQRDKPALLGVPVIVGGVGRRGVVSSPSYEARKYGVRSAMPMYVALRLCPQAVTIAPRMSRYVDVSRRLMALFGRFTPLVEPLSLDEAFLDISGTQQLFGPPVDVAWKIQRAIRDELGLSASVGVSATKYVAKVASELKKPGGMVVVTPGEERAFLEPLALQRLWGVGARTAERLHALGLATIGDVFRFGAPSLAAQLGTLGEHLHALSSGADARAVELERSHKSVGAEHTLQHDIVGRARIRQELLPLVDEVAHTLRVQNTRASGVRLKLKYADFRRTSRELHFAEAAQDAASMMVALDALLDRVDVQRPIRLVGLAAIGLVDATAARQTSLFAAAPEGQLRHEQLGRALDAIKGKYGAAAVVRGDLGKARRQRYAADDENNDV